MSFKQKVRKFLERIWYSSAKVKIITPQPFQVVEKEFWIHGKVPKFWLDYGKYGLGIEWLDINGSMFGCQGTNIYPGSGLFGKLQRKVRFSAYINFPNISEEYLNTAGGRLTFDINGLNGNSFYLPVVIKGLRADLLQEPSLKKKHIDGINRVIRCKDGQKKYHEELNNLYEKRKLRYENALNLEKNSKENMSNIQDEKILDGVFEIIQYAEDPERKEIDGKYKETIEWSGPLLHGRVDRMDGFIFQVYSNDHDPPHFHVLHRGQGVDAIFSFPEIKLISYKKSKNYIGSSDINRIQEFFKKPDNLKRLETELIRTRKI